MIKNYRASVIAGLPGTGKALSINTLVRTPNKWVPMSELKIGDYVIAKDGSKSKITDKSESMVSNYYHIVFEDGRELRACENHLWKVYIKGKESILTTKEILNKLEYKSYKNNLYIDLPDSEQNKDKKLPIHPYILGCWLAHGATLSGNEANLIFKSNSNIINKLQEYKDKDYVLTYKSYLCTKGQQNNFISISPLDKNSNNKYVNSLLDLKIGNLIQKVRFIPDIYLNGSTEQRWDLLRGILDSHGCVNINTSPKREFNSNVCGSISINCASSSLTESIVTLVRSLGGLARVNPINKGNTISYKTNIRFKYPSLAFYDFAKLNKLKDQHRFTNTLKLRIKEIIYSGQDLGQCISIEHPDKLYIAENYIPTHNSSFSRFTNGRAIDLDSIKFIKTNNGKYNPEFPKNYVRCIIELLENNEYDYILISPHVEVFRLLRQFNIEVFVVYPDMSRKDEFFKNYVNRGNNKEFLDGMSDSWDTWITLLNSREFRSYQLQEGEYLSEELIEKKLPFLKPTSILK